MVAAVTITAAAQGHILQPQVCGLLGKMHPVHETVHLVDQLLRLYGAH